MALEALPRPGRVPEQRFLSPKIRRWQRRSYGTLSGNLPIDLGFSVGRLFIGEGARQEATKGVSPQGGATRGWVVPPHGEAGPWPPSSSLSVLVLCPGKIGV
jgi:hypothetical protein